MQSKFVNLNAFFAALLAIATFYFLYWGLAQVHLSHSILFVSAAIFGIFMAFNIGGNDVANSFGTSVGAGTLTIKQALVVAAIFEVSGAVIAGGAVTDTIRKGIVDLSVIEVEPLQFVYIMMSALLAAGIWLLFATRNGYPVSTTHSIVGGIVGSSIALGFLLGDGGAVTGLVNWRKIAEIAVSWVVSPALGGCVAYALFYAIKTRIVRYNEEAEARLEAIRTERQAVKKRHKRAFERLSEIQQVAYVAALARDSFDDPEDPGFSPDDIETDYRRDLHRIQRMQTQVYAHKALESYVPLVAAGGSMVISAMVLFKGLENLQLALSTFNELLILLMIGAAVWMLTSIFAKTMRHKSLNDSTFIIFSWLQVFTAAGFAFSHGSNDIANAIGPFAAILDVLRTGGIGAQSAIPPIALITFGVALVAGLWFIGREVIQTVGHKLTTIHPASGFSAELAAAAVVMAASMAGIPVSSTHILIGAVLGVGLVNRKANWALMKPIALAWVITVPAAAMLSALIFVVLSNTF